jgi:multiple sugar transport system permease protein
MIGKRNLSTGIRTLLALGLVVLAGFPVFWMINTAMTPSGALYAGNQQWIPDFTR